MEAAAPQTPAGAAADIPDEIGDIHEIFHHARRLVAEKPANQALLDEITQEWNRIYPIDFEEPRFVLDPDRFMRDIDADPVPLFLR